MRDRFLGFWSRLVLTHPQTVLVVVLLGSLAAAAVVPGLRVEAGHSKMEAKDNVHYRRFDDFLAKFGSPNMLIALAEGGTEELRRGLVRELLKVLPAKGSAREKKSNCSQEDSPNSPHCVKDMVGRVDLEAFKAKALLYIPAAQIKTLVQGLEGEFLEGIAAHVSSCSRRP